MKLIPAILVSILLIAAACTQQLLRPTGTATIPVMHERLYLSPLTNESPIERLPGWPAESYRQKILLRSFREVSDKLNSEFIRCEKYGLYTMVSDAGEATVRISVTLLPYTFTNDTLKMPVRLQAERIPDGQKYIYSLDAFATAPPGFGSSDSFHRLGLLFSDYRRHFPCDTLVSFFYSHQ